MGEYLQTLKPKSLLQLLIYLFLEALTISRGATVTSKILPVKEDKFHIESDAEKLCKYWRDKEPGPKILPDSEYPEWLFNMQLEALPELEDMDPETHGWLYWRAFLKRQREQAERLKKLKYKKIHLQNAPALKKPKLWKR
ncbi:hypothetical protein M3Y97_01033900 [Aphelenchoides bicaudatus]|nr:hypothetical protein M3Y97_01033900 [Aphelenchoides bicaudatus]